MGRATKGEKPTNKPKNVKKNEQIKKPKRLLELTDKHLHFCKRYVLTGRNACKAARESGFNEWYASVELLKDPLIIEEVDRYASIRAKKFEVNAERVIAELVKVAFGSLGDFIKLTPDGTPIIDCTEVGAEEMAALSEITQDVYYERTSSDPEDGAEPVKKTKIKMHSKVQALEQLARIFKLFGDEGNIEKDTPEGRASKIRAMFMAMKEQGDY